MNGEPADSGRNELEQLTAFRGAPAEFWPAFLAYAARLVGARAALLACRPRGDAPDAAWSLAFAWPATGPEAEPGPRGALRRAASEMADGVWAAGRGARPLPIAGFRGEGAVLGVRLPVDGDASLAAAFFHLAERPDEKTLDRQLELLRVAAAVPAAFQVRLQAARTNETAVRLGAVLDTLAILNRETRFMAAAMTLCNDVAGRCGCDRVSLGWAKGDYVRLQSVSHAEKFERRMAAVRQVEIVMEEALDQDEEIVWPPPAGAAYVAREHEAFAREQGAAHVCAVPLREGDKPVAVLLCERSQAPFGEAELAHLRVLADQVVARLADLHRRDRWFGVRWAEAARRGLARLAGPEHTWAKLAGVAGVVAVAALTLWPVAFRIQTPFLMRADTSVFLPAPFDGFLATVQAEPGAIVRTGDVVLALDTRELLLEEAAAVADQLRYQRESEKARADNALAAMRIAAAQAEQARVRLELARHRLAQAELKAPFDGVVVEGDLKERLGAPVRQGDTLLRIARLDELHAELEVDQRDVQDVRDGALARLAFASRPGQRHTARVERLEPVAQAREGRNVFVARCALAERPADWMRPGMTGVGKVEAGRRSLAWIVTRRTADYLRLHLWW